LKNICKLYTKKHQVGTGQTLKYYDKKFEWGACGIFQIYYTLCEKDITSKRKAAEYMLSITVLKVIDGKLDVSYLFITLYLICLSYYFCFQLIIKIICLLKYIINISR